jgi:DNA-3-methyladenine glycosylase I
LTGRRCFGTGDALSAAYHDEEWGRPVRDERGIYERLCLEGFQSGLSWLTILRKREAFRRGFADFDPDVVARFDTHDVARLLAPPSLCAPPAPRSTRFSGRMRPPRGRRRAHLPTGRP